MILVRPLITEKAIDGARDGRYTFIVERTATKHQVKEEVQKLFGVTVLRVHTAKNAGKTKRVGKMRKPITTALKKKALVTIKKGETIDVIPVVPEEKKS